MRIPPHKTGIVVHFNFLTQFFREPLTTAIHTILEEVAHSHKLHVWGTVQAVTRACGGAAGALPTGPYPAVPAGWWPKPAVVFGDHHSPAPSNFDLKFDKVSFRYSDDLPWAVAGMDFEISQDRCLAVVGETGSGKSTLVNLLARFWEPDIGRIMIGGKDIRSLSESDLRRCMGVVSQHAHMFNMNLRDNLLLARAGASEADLYAALETAQLADFVHALPDGLNTRIGESGRLLSAGQARRLAVARLILKDAPLWVLDEPTEGLDIITEQKMMDALYERMAGKTVLMITHRLVNLQGMDHIILLENGSIIEQGSHADLLSSNSRYAALCKRIN